MNTPAPRRRRGRGCLFTFLGVVGLIVVIIVIVAVASGGGASAPSGGSQAGQAAAGPAHIGDKVRDGKFEFTVTAVTHVKKVGDTSIGLGATAQGRFTILHVTVTNIGSESQSLDDSAQFVYDASGRKFDASSTADLYITGNDVFFNDINPGNTVHGLIAFDMPAGDSAVTAELHDSVFSGGVKSESPVKAINWIAAAVAVIALGIGTAGLLAGENARSQVRTEQAQLAAEQRQITTEQARFKAEQTALVGQVNGVHRDLITCGDVSTLEIYIDGIVSSQGALGPIEFVGPNSNIVNSLPLPSHCINR